MRLLVVLLVLAAPQSSTPKADDVTLMKANLGGSCSAEFTVKDTGNKPVYAALVHVRVRYGFAGVKRADLEVGTSSAGKARIEGLPDKAKPMTYDIAKDDKKAEVTQDVAEMCHATFDVALK
ncbi:MAG TPA: hypothetical protein VLV86_11830 [Vicinamibacterales bacterium]|nr:hypothetical protein [Vicinamibacterales bacterium]